MPPRPARLRLCSMLAFGVGMVFPTFESFKAIESKQLGDDTQVGWRPTSACSAALLTAGAP